jgi:hypothetical protein
MPELISIEEFSKAKNLTIVDVRKAPARGLSGLTMPDAVWRAPFSADNWWQEFVGQRVVVRYLAGGFEAYREAGGAVVAISDHE